MADAEIKTGILRHDLELISDSENIIYDPAADNYFKVSAKTLKMMSLLTDNVSVSELIANLAKIGISASKEEILNLYVFLKQNNLLIPEYGEIAAKRNKEQAVKDKTFLLRFSAAYLFFKLPPWRPENFFKKIAPFVSFLASKWFLLLFAVPAVIGYLLVLRDFPLVKTTFLNSISWAGLVRYFAAVIVLKIIHEVAHSIAAMHFNCRVRGIGIGFMVFYPRLYTDTTDSWRLPRRQRLLIDAAGIIAEILIGGLAACLWNYLPPGKMQSTMFYIFAVSTISSLLVNGNPCIRYDGYYILCDLLNIDNLMTRSADFFKRWWRWTFLRLGAAPESGHNLILFLFGVVSTIYRIFLYTAIILIIYHKFTKFLAVIMIFLELYSILIYPCWKEIQTLQKLSRKSPDKVRYIFPTVFLCIFSVILFCPISWNIELPGESVNSQRTQVTVLENGYLCNSLLKQSQCVSQGDILFKLKSPQLDFRISELRGTMKYDTILLSLQQLDDKRFPESVITTEKIESDKVALVELERRKQALDIKSRQDGVFLLHHFPLHKGVFLPKGAIVGEILSGKIIINAYADDSEIGKLAVGDIAVVFARDDLKKYSAKITEINKIPILLKNSPVLQSHGGPVPVYFDNESNNFFPDKTLYRIVLHTDTDCNFTTGRFVFVQITHSEQLFRKIYQYCIAAFRREF